MLWVFPPSLTWRADRQTGRTEDQVGSSSGKESLMHKVIVGRENSAEIEIYYTDSVQGGDRGSLQDFLGSVPRPAVVNHQCAPASGTEPVPQ